jgi:hypothetical protein
VSEWVICPMCEFACVAMGDKPGHVEFMCGNSECVAHEVVYRPDDFDEVAWLEQWGAR